jgi:hypothetical protein
MFVLARVRALALEMAYVSGLVQTPATLRALEVTIPTLAISLQVHP